MKSRHYFVSTLATGVVFLGLSAAQAQDPSTPKHANQTEGSSDRMKSNITGSADQHFMIKAAQGGMAEVELGKLAQHHASSQAVKDFGQHMIDDHSKANDELKDLASKKNVTLPTEVGAEDKATIDRLSKLHGGEFDKAYMHDMVEDHNKDVAEFQKEADSGVDSDVKAWASKTLPTLQHHLQMAQDTVNK